MSMYNLQTLNAEVEAQLHGTTLNQITNLGGLYNRAARELLLQVDLQETKKSALIPVFPDVVEYPLAADVKGNKIIDIRPVTQTVWRTTYPQDYTQAFSVGKNSRCLNQFTITFNGANSTGSLNKNLSLQSPYILASTVLNATNSTSGNGLWQTDNVGAVSLMEENVNFINSTAALSFSLQAGQNSGYVENTTQTAVDISAFTGQGTFLFNLYLPNGSAITAVQLFWGTDNSNYYTNTVTQTQQQTPFQNGWNLISIPWTGATTLGSPDSNSIGFLQVKLSYDGTAQSGVILNQIIYSLGAEFEYVYYSKYLFRNPTTGVYQETCFDSLGVLDTSLLLNLDTESYNLFVYLVMYFAVQQQQGITAEFFDANYFLTQYNNALARYKRMYLSETIKPTELYYKVTKPSRYNITRWRSSW